MGLVVVAINSGSTVVNERSDTAGDIPVTISGALVCVVEETVVGVFFVRRRLWDWVERVVYGAFEGGHLGNVAMLICVEVVSGGHVLIDKRSTECCSGSARIRASTRQSLWLAGSLGDSMMIATCGDGG